MALSTVVDLNQSRSCSRCFVGSLSNTKCLPLTDNYNFLIMNLNLYLNHCNAIILLKLWHLLILQKSPLDIIEKSFDTSSLCLLLNVVGVGILVCFLCPPFCFRCIHKAYTVLSCCLIPKLSCNSAQGLTLVFFLHLLYKYILLCREKVYCMVWFYTMLVLPKWWHLQIEPLRNCSLQKQMGEGKDWRKTDLVQYLNSLNEETH